MQCWWLLFSTLLSLNQPSTGLKYLDFLGDGSNRRIIGSLTSDFDYAVLAADNKASLPDQFTICSSIYNSHFVSGQGFFQLIQEDGNTWFNLIHLYQKVVPEENAYQQFGLAMITAKIYSLSVENYTPG